MPRILSVSYDEGLLKSRQLLLERQGCEVVSAHGYTAALDECNSGNPYHLFILGHSIPHKDKESLVAAFRAHFSAPIIALKKTGEGPVQGADFLIDPEPTELLALVAKVVAQKAQHKAP